MKAWYQISKNTLYYNYQYGLEDNVNFLMNSDDYENLKDIYKNPSKYNIIEIETGDNFPIDIIHEDVKVIKFNFAFNQNISKLPSHIEELHFCEDYSDNYKMAIYDKPLDYLSYGIKKLYLNANFNQKLLNLPESLEYIEFKEAFNQSLDYLPNSVKEIHFSHIAGDDGEPIFCYFNQPINKLPENLEILTLDCIEFNHPLDNLSKTLKILYLDLYAYEYPLDNLPETLKDLTLYIHERYSYPIDNLPEKLEHLRLFVPKIYKFSIEKLPKSLQSCKIHYY